MYPLEGKVCFEVCILAEKALKGRFAFKARLDCFLFARQGQAACGGAKGPLDPLFWCQTFQKQKAAQASDKPRGHQSGIPIRPSQARKM